MYTKIAKPGWDAVLKNALDYSMIKEKQHFLVNTKYPQPTKKIQSLLDPNVEMKGWKAESRWNKFDQTTLFSQWLTLNELSALLHQAW